MNSCWFEKLPPEDFDDDKSTFMTQLRATKWSSKIQFYRKLRSPRNASELFRLRSLDLVWMDEASFIVKKKLPKSVPFFSKFRKAAASLDFTKMTLFVYGISDFAVANTLFRLLYLRNGGAQEVRIGDQFNRTVEPLVPTCFIKSDKLVLGSGCHLSRKQSVALASHPDPLHLGLDCMFEDWGRAFVETLKQRTSDFGTLWLRKQSFDRSYTEGSSFQLLAELMNVSQISLGTTSSIFQGAQCLLPFSSHARRLEYEVYDDVAIEEVELVTVVPKAVTLVFRGSLPSRLHSIFLQASGNLQELGLIYGYSHVPTMAQQKELLKAITTNENLHRLELGDLAALEDFWDELLEVLGSCETLRSVIFWVRSLPNLDLMYPLAKLLEEQSYLDISFKYRGTYQYYEKKMEGIIGPVRLRNRARALARESAHARPTVVGAALASWAAGNFSKTGAILNENTDLLCTLLGQSPSTPSSSPRRRGKRQRELPSIPEVSNQKKIQT